MANDSHKEQSAAIPAQSENNAWTTIQGKADQANVPLILTITLNTKEVNKTYKIELRYSSEIKPLDYYHYGDNETAFRQN